MMKTVLSILGLVAATAFAQQRCDAQFPQTYCNTTEILAFESNECTKFHIFISRGSDEPYPGRQGNVTGQICSKLGKDACSFENIGYAARSTPWGKDEWCKSAAEGAVNGQAQLKGYLEKCPDSKLILLGYSQGGSVVQDILGGGGGHVFECDQATNPALDESIGANVVATVTFGAVARSKNQNFTIGGGKDYDGLRARTPEQMVALSKYSDRLRDYCHSGDPVCAVGSTPVTIPNHLNYFEKHNEEVLAWVVSKATGKSEQSSDDSSSTSVAAKSAAGPTPTASVITSSTHSGTDSLETAASKQSTTGAASRLNAFSGSAAFVALVVSVLANTS